MGNQGNVTIGIGLSILVLIFLFQLYRYMPIIRARSRRRKFEALRDELTSVRIQIAEHEQYAEKPTTAIEQGVTSTGYIARNGRPGSGVNRVPIDVKTFEERYEILLKRRQVLEQELGISTN